MSDNMSWEDTLKISRKEATELGDKYAPEDMKEFRLEQSNKRKEKYAPVFRRFLSELKNLEDWVDDDHFLKIRSALSAIARDIENAPRFRGKNREQIIEILEEYLGE